jgi:hypothetical protein
MGRKRHCTICADAAIAGQIRAQIEAGCRQKLIAEQNPGFSVSQISRHARFCLTPQPKADLSTEQGSQEIARWLERAEATFLVAQANGDTKSAASAISTAVRTLSAMHKKQERELEQERASADHPDRSLKIGDLDKLVADYTAKLDSENGGVAEKVQGLLIESPNFTKLVFAIWADRNLLPVLLERITINANAND